MSFLKDWWRALLKKGFKFSYTGTWPGEKDLPDHPCWPKTPTKEECEQEIRDSLNKKKEGV